MFQDSSRAIPNWVFAVTALVLLMATNAWSASYKVMYNFNNTNANPSSGLITDAAGNAYGTTLHGGHNNFGTVYELSPTSGYHLLYVFTFSGPGGIWPQGNLVFDSAGNLYGTTLSGGDNKTACGGRGCGVVFKLSPPQGGGLWTETVLYNFCSQANCADGANPSAGVILDSSGNLYGTTEGGGNQNPGCNQSFGGCGTVFEVEPSQSGWTETVLYAFQGGNADGQSPLGGLVFDSEGSLYGTVQGPGPNFGGSAFRLSPSGGTWTFSVIYAFNGNSGSKDGNTPVTGLIFDSLGNLYGTTLYGGQFGFGTVFELTPAAGGWTENVLYNFAGGRDGSWPEASPVLDLSGNLYGTTVAGGGNGCSNGYGCGTAFKLTSEVGGQWMESLFRFGAAFGIQPSAPLLLQPPGDDVYGTTTAGGSKGNGVAFRITQ